MSIETGFSCNAYCGFCPQLNYRGELLAGLSPDLTTDELRERIRYGAQNGYRQIGFSGGEPTIRKDIVELVAFSRSQGYELIGMTTNGMMMSYPAFTAAILRAGLNSINFSVNGPTAKLHDAMMRTPGSFDQLMRGMDTVRTLRDKARLRVEMMSMSLAAPQVIEHFPEIVRLTGERGVRLHMIQPFLMTKGNTHLAHNYLTSYAAIEQAVRAAVEVAKGHDGHIKLFNTPVCLFWDIESQLERQWKKLDVFREHEKGTPGELTVSTTKAQRDTPAGYYRVEACATCDEPCNGFRSEYFPQTSMVEQILEAMDRHLGEHGPRMAGELWVGGMELLDADSQRRVLGGARERGVGRLVLLSGGIGRGYYDLFEEETQRLVDEVCFVVQPRRADARELKDRHLAHGNFDDLRKGLERLRRRIERDPDAVSATLSIHDLRRDPSLPEQLQALGLRHLRLGEELNSRPDARHFSRSHDWPALLAQLGAHGIRVSYLGRGEIEEGMEITDWRARFLRHPWTTRDAEWIVWSVPSWCRPMTRQSMTMRWRAARCPSACARRIWPPTRRANGASGSMHWRCRNRCAGRSTPSSTSTARPPCACPRISPVPSPCSRATPPTW